MNVNISKHFDKNNLHHAYLIEGAHEKIVPEIFEFIKGLGIETSGNPDFCHMVFDNLKMADALYLREMNYQKGISQNKKIFIVCVNNFTLEAEQALLKMFEEPIENTHFFLIIPDVNSLLPTVISRFYLIRSELKNNEYIQLAEGFINMTLQNRINFLKEFLVGTKENEEDEDIKENLEFDSLALKLESPRVKALKLLNMIESSLHNKMSRMPCDISGTHYFEHIFKVREFLRQPGSSAKNLMEGVALIIPKML